VDSTSVINGNLCYVVNIYFDGVLHESEWFLNENGYVRWYAFITYGMGADTLDWDEFYIMKQFPQIGDSWQGWADGPKLYIVVDSLTVTVPAGSFSAFEVEIREPDTYDLFGKLYWADNVGCIKTFLFGATGVLTEYEIYGGFGCFPLEVLNEWHSEADTTGNGIYQIHEEVNKYRVLQTFPNPFNSSTTISFTLPAKEHITLQAFDIQGRCVASIAEGEYPAGENRAVFEGKGLVSGIYLVKLQAGKFNQIQKVILLK
jgi:hypothetical protein